MRVIQDGGEANQNNWSQLAVIVTMTRVCMLEMSS